jgi:hypothetical protein
MEVSMNIFARMLERLGVQRGEDRGMSVLYDSRDDWDEILAQARMTARALQTEIKYAPPGKKLNVITTSDLGKKTEK